MEEYSNGVKQTACTVACNSIAHVRTEYVMCAVQGTSDWLGWVAADPAKFLVKQRRHACQKSPYLTVIVAA
jgi:hypothetical protein